MADKLLPFAPSLEYYRKQARALLKSVQSGDTLSFDRVCAQLSRFTPGDTFLLSHAHWVLAREHGFPSWSKFKRHLEALPVESPTPAIDPIDDSAEPKEQPMTAAQAAPRGGSISGEAVYSATGRTWDEWFAIFDSAGCAGKTHKEIVAVARENGAGAWWRQMVAVQYERTRGLREMHMGCDGDFRVNVSRTIGAPISALFEAWNDPARRQCWLPGADLSIRKANTNKALRITWNQVQNLDVNLMAKGDERSQCAVEHSKLSGQSDVEQQRAYWASALDRLKALLES